MAYSYSWNAYQLHIPTSAVSNINYAVCTTINRAAFSRPSPPLPLCVLLHLYIINWGKLKQPHINHSHQKIAVLMWYMYVSVYVVMLCTIDTVKIISIAHVLTPNKLYQCYLSL